MKSPQWQRVRRRGVLVSLTALAAGVTGWRWLRTARRPNLLLITLDTTRADRIGCYGCATALTPALDSLAAGGVLFERASAAAPLTLPSHTTMMTGLYPQEHGLLTNGRGRLEQDIPTLAEVLRLAGYDTAAFVASFVLHAKFGLDRGFSTYDDDLADPGAPPSQGMYRQRSGARVAESALAWLRQRRSAPFFCWVHLYDPHDPYVAHPDEFGDRFAANPYDGEIAYMDLQVQKLLSDLDSRGLRDETLIVAVGDHGESLGEHHEQQHGLTLYQAAMHVPWIFSGWGVTTPGRRIPHTVSLIDLMPTVLDIAGLADAALTASRSLRPALSGAEMAPRECCAATDDPLLEHGWAPLRSLTTQNWKFIRSVQPELYDLTADPREETNLAATQPDRAAELDGRLAALEQVMVVRTAAAVELTPRERRALASLGYVADAGPAPTADERDAPLPDVKQMLPLYNQVEAAYQLLTSGDAVAAERRLRELLAENPEYTRTQLYLASALTDLQRFAESTELARQVLAQDPDNVRWSAMAFFLLGANAWGEQKIAEAAESFRRAAEIEPAAPALFHLGSAQLELGDAGGAEKSFRDALEQDEGYVRAHQALGVLLTRQGRIPDAIGHFREAVRFDPAMVEAHGNLAVLLAGQRRFSEAGEHFATAARLRPDNAELRFNYGSFLLLQGQLEAGIRELEETLRIDPQHQQAAVRLEQARSLRR